MQVITARNVNDAWMKAKVLLVNNHTVRPSRVGEVWEAPFPVTTVYTHPRERVLFDPVRNANPYFHFFEGLWMLAGHKDVEFVAQFVKRMREFSDDGEVFHGAYGYRWRHHFDMYGGAEDGFADQLTKIVRMLKANPNERRAVLMAWDPTIDLDRPEIKDIPCNVCAFFKVREGALTMTVNCRSNDIVWGALGSNVVHFSMLQEYVAAMAGYPVGSYWQVSDSWHAYTERWEPFGGNNAHTNPNGDPYTVGAVAPYPMVQVPEAWDDDLRRWFAGNQLGFENSFFPEVVLPMADAWNCQKMGEFHSALIALHYCKATDWRKACAEWIYRKMDARAKKDAQLC